MILRYIYNLGFVRKRIISIRELPNDAIIISVGLNTIRYTINLETFYCRVYGKEFTFWSYVKHFIRLLSVFFTKGLGFAAVFLLTDTSATNNKETGMRNTAATTNFSTELNFYVRNYASDSDIFSTLTDWTLPSGSGTISAVKFYAYNLSTSTGHPVNVYKVLRTWVENQATWNIYSTGNNWTTAGALGDGTDIVNTVIDQTTVSTINTWYNWVLMGTGSDNPLTLTWGDNVNLKFKSAGANNAYTNDFAGKRYLVDTAKRPYIEITYTASTTNPSKLAATHVG